MWVLQKVNCHNKISLSFSKKSTNVLKSTQQKSAFSNRFIVFQLSSTTQSEQNKIEENALKLKKLQQNMYSIIREELEFLDYNLRQVFIHFEETVKKQQEFAIKIPKTLPSDIFVNVEINLDNIDSFGFDYGLIYLSRNIVISFSKKKDYTLVNYTDALQHFIFNEARSYLIQTKKYPHDLMHFNYDPNFAIRVYF